MTIRPLCIISGGKFRNQFVRERHERSIRFCKLASSYSQSMVEEVEALDILD